MTKTNKQKAQQKEMPIIHLDNFTIRQHFTDQELKTGAADISDKSD